jgi:hypothetical protein
MPDTCHPSDPAWPECHILHMGNLYPRVSLLATCVESINKRTTLFTNWEIIFFSDYYSPFFTIATILFASAAESTHYITKQVNAHEIESILRM